MMGAALGAGAERGGPLGLLPLPAGGRGAAAAPLPLPLPPLAPPPPLDTQGLKPLAGLMPASLAACWAKMPGRQGNSVAGKVGEEEEVRHSPPCRQRPQ